METERLQNFNDRLSKWVANQGFWFQIRYSMSSTGMRGLTMFHLLRLGYRILVFLLIVTLGIWIFLVKRIDSKTFNTGASQQLKSGLSAERFEMGGLSRRQGQLEISRLAAEGDNETFFTTLVARNIRCKMKFLDGLVGTWEPGIISIAKLDIDLQAGADDAESARKLADALFRKPVGIEANSYEVADATLRWGFSERTQGAIESSVLKMQRTETGWRMSFKGGVFHQNWLRDLKIENLVVLCEPEGLVFETAEFKQGNGTVDFAGLRVTGGERPEVSGVVKIRNLLLEKVIPPAVANFIEGSISGDFRVFGSTNTSNGIGFEGQVLMDGVNEIALRDRVHILRALSVVDYFRNYNRVDFREGSFQLKTVGGGLELSEVNLKAGDIFTLQGALNVRLPTQEEIQAEVGKNADAESSALFAGEGDGGTLGDGLRSKSDFSLKRAALEAKRIRDGGQSEESLSLFDRLGLNLELRRLQSEASERMSRMLQYQGLFLITVPNDAFERAGELRQLYPVDSASNRIPIRVPIEGGLYELTLKQAEDIYQQGRR
jgi:hypothetical protein